MIPTWLAVSIIGVTCGIAFGLLVLRSSAEARSNELAGKPALFMVFGGSSFLQVLASGLVTAILHVMLFFGPSLLLLSIFNLVPLCGNDYSVWGFSLFGGAGIGKVLRWWRWKNSRDYV